MNNPRAVFRGSQWRGLSAVRNLFVFGDSYSSIDDSPDFVPRPAQNNASNPLGLSDPSAFPGDPWTEYYLDASTATTKRRPNWVGHLSRIARNGNGSGSGNGLRIYDYARGGDNVQGLAHQIHSRCIPQLRSGGSSVDWTPQDSLFLVWIGINDMAETSNPVQPIKRLFALIDDLYNLLGARNIVLVDCPPIHRSPGVLSDPDAGPNPDRFEDWNRLLFMQARFFVAKHQDYMSSSSSPSTSSPARQHHYHSSSSSTTSPATTPKDVGVEGETSMFVFSSWSTFMSILDYPEAYGFGVDYIDEAQGPVWMDDLHPTSKVHEIIAKHLHKFLADIPPEPTNSLGAKP